MEDTHRRARLQEDAGEALPVKVAVVGLSPSTRHLVPKDWDIWALPWDNEYGAIASRLFEMHDRGLLEKPEALRKESYFDDLAEMPQPIYMQKHWDDIPSSIPYPLGEVASIFKGFPRGRWDTQKDWYNSSPAYMIALAIHEGATTIGLYGIDILDDSEYTLERPCLEYLIGLAVGRGIEVIVPEGPSALGKFRGTGIKLGTMEPVYKARYGYL